jgi:acyl-CoA reductase-like NAD-dependent aldehyde dehydrogenase
MSPSPRKHRARPRRTGRPDSTPAPARIALPRTYELFVNGTWTRSESGRFRRLVNERGQIVTRVPHASARDLNQAVAAARQAGGSWASRTAFQRGQILFRMAEQLEDRAPRLVQELVKRAGWKEPAAAGELTRAVDRLFHWAGWADKFAPMLGGVNPVAAPFVNFTVPEPVGVVVVFAPTHSPLLGLITQVSPALASGSTVVVVVDHETPTVALDWAETLAVSSLPPGVVNVLTGLRAELVAPAARHGAVQALVHHGAERDEITAIEREVVAAPKRIVRYDDLAPAAWHDPSWQDLDRIVPFVIWKTIWHPAGY